MLNPSDVYVQGGSDNLLACWTDKVTKYDASSFYNFEQDNLPLHDLDERTTLLWEKFGHPTSSLTGMSFVVSADAVSSCNPLYFTTLSACINALPEVINYPILVEVASFGDLGTLNISNKAFGPNGSLEIINRNSAFAGAMDLSGNVMAAEQYDTAYTDFNLASAVAPTSAASGASGPGLAFDMQSAQIFSTGQYISSAVNRWTDLRYNYNAPYVFSKKVRGTQLNRLTGSLSSTIAPWVSSLGSYAAANSFKFVPFDKNRATAGGAESNINVYDASTLNIITNTDINWGDGRDFFDSGSDSTASKDVAAAAFAYFNNLASIKVHDCNGPIFIRNFNVDGENSRTRGIEIKNSTVNLERCSVSRCTEAGLHTDNSEVNLLRGFVSYRNYGFDNATRTGIPYRGKRETYQVMGSYGAGIRAVNSHVNFKSTYVRDLDKSLQASASLGLGAYDGYVGGLPAPSLEALYCLSRNDIGIDAVDSNITGGRTELNGSSLASYNDATQIFSELSTEAGIRLNNSVLNYSGRLLVDGNYFGLDSVNSKMYVDSFAARFNQSTALNLVNSDFAYNKDLYGGLLQSDTDHVESFLQSQVAFIDNGQAIASDNSVVRPLYTSSMPSTYKMVYASGCFGMENDSTKILPTVHLKGGSDADFIHTHLEQVVSGGTGAAQYGLLANVEDNSTMTMRGSNDYANILIGPGGRFENSKVAGIYVNNGSTIKVQGPTSLVRMGVNILAEDSSNIEMTPHQTNKGALLVSSFNLSDSNNHTMVELHSTRACLVANKNSNIFLENLGDYSNKWASGAYGGSIDITQDYASPSAATFASGGFLQFYPNANTDPMPGGLVVSDFILPTGNSRYTFVDGTNPAPRKFVHDVTNDISGISTGGMCVRAVENSVVHANNVHFPATWHNTSSMVYDLVGAAPLLGPKCSRLFIWNIADDSLLKASYLSVNGKHPRDAGYHGPSGVYTSGVAGGFVASGAPHATPDTSSLSVLDYYGHGPANPFGKSVSGENFGAFRLYFSVDPVTNFMVATEQEGLSHNSLAGWARQIFAQGYNFSGNLVASGDAGSTYFSAVENNLGILQRQNVSTRVVEPSGFYYASAMLATPNNVKAVLDDSALNSFANAKHNTVGKSGLGKVVQGYYAASGFGGDSYNDYAYGKGIASINNFDLKKDN
tara:strand:+ start:20212 stop:23715 length:3504 start_codon:yes stop_codon:yes gene_type:complete